MMNSKKNINHYKLVIVLLIVMEIFFVFLSIKSFNNKNLDKYIVGVNNKTNKMLAIMLEDENGDYKPYNSETFPEFPYIFNSELSQCIDIKGNTIENAISYDEDANLANVIVTKTSQCYFYFNRPKEVGVDITNKLISSGELWQSGLEGDGYRYVGSGAYNSATTPNNFICFGTSGKTECKNNEAKYMYRIIGVFPDGKGQQHLKLISLKQLSSTYAWNADYETNAAWENSDVYKGLNGSYFLTNTTYDYLQNSTWLNKIENWTWSAVNTKTYDGSGGPNYYNSLSPSQIYLHEMNRSSKTSSIGEWSTPTAKIGLMYASDYTLSLGSSALAIAGSTSSNASTLSTGWMHQSNNDTTSSTAEWTLSRIGGYYGGFHAWYVNSDGYVGHHSVHHASGVRPVFYLTKDIIYDSGSGTYSDPYTILETTPSNYSNLSISAKLSENVVTGVITKGDYDLNKYCINTSRNSYENCTWKRIDSLTVTDTLPDYGTYYLHVIDKGGYVVHSKALEYVEPMSSKLISSGELWQSGLESDGYRYVGSGAYYSETSSSNFICFGTSDKTECKNNKAKYMYRIIGVFEGTDGNQHLKLISLEQLGRYAWNADYLIDVNWESSTLYTGLNGSYFLTNTTYDYLQNNTWLNKIEDWTWNAVNTKTSSSGPDYNTITVQEMYLHEMNRSSKTSSIGSWTNPTAKIGLMYASDYTLSLGSSALAITGSTYTNSTTLKTGWMHQSNNDTASSSHEWTLSRYGDTGGNFRAWYVVSDGSVGNYLVYDAYGVRPVFYLTSDVKYNSGTGTYTDPYIINE